MRMVSDMATVASSQAGFHRLDHVHSIIRQDEAACGRGAATVNGNCDRARMPEGRMADMKPPLPLISFSRRIGSPVRKVRANRRRLCSG